MCYTLKKEIKELCSDKKIWIGLLLVLIIIIIGTSYNREKYQIKTTDILKLGVINKDDSSYSDLLLTYFNGSETFSSLISVELGETDKIKEAFLKGNLDIYMEIPEDFSQNMIRMEHAPIQVTINIEDSTKAILFQNILKSYEKYIAAVEANAVGLYEIMEQDGMEPQIINETNQKISFDMIFTALGKEEFFSFQQIDRFPSTKVSVYYIISVLLMTMMYTGLYVGFRMLQEIKLGTLIRLKTTQTSVSHLLTAKMLLMVVLLTILSSVSIRAINNQRITMEGIILCLSVSLLCVIFAIFISTLFATTQRFTLVGNLLLFYFIIIGGGIIPIQFLPQDILQLSKLTPNYYMMEGMLRYIQGQRQFTNRISLGLFLLSALLYGISLFLYQRRRVTNE